MCESLNMLKKKSYNVRSQCVAHCQRNWKKKKKTHTHHATGMAHQSLFLWSCEDPSPISELLSSTFFFLFLGCFAIQVSQRPEKQKELLCRAISNTFRFPLESLLQMPNWDWEQEQCIGKEKPIFTSVSWLGLQNSSCEY